MAMRGELFQKLEQALRQLYIVHHHTAFPTHYNRNSKRVPSFIDHVLPHSYPECVSKLESLAVKFLTHCKKPRRGTPLFLFALLHALRARDIQRWNNIAISNGCPDPTVSTIKDLMSSHSKLMQLFFLSNSPYYVSDPNVKRWYLEYLHRLVPPTKAGSLSAIHPDEKSPPTSDKAEMAKLIEATWAPVFSKKEPEYDLLGFLDKIGHLLPDYSGFTVDLSDEAIVKSVSGLPSDSAPGPDGITYSLIKQALPAFMPVIRNIYSLMSSGRLPAKGYTDGFINFIEKKDCIPTAGNLRPLTIPNTLHRLIGKILSDQLQPYLTCNIHPCQSAFIH